MKRLAVLKLVRHGESGANAGVEDMLEIGDANISLTERGIQQARLAGRKLGRDYFIKSLIYVSPYKRTRQTLEFMLEGVGLSVDEIRVYEDPRLREVDHGYEDVLSQQEARRIHGWFYYRYKGGESPAQCDDRGSGFFQSMMRQVKRKKCASVCIVTHGLTLRCLVRRFLHLRVEAFEEISNPDNCDIVTIQRRTTGKGWTVDGLKMREGSIVPKQMVAGSTQRVHSTDSD